MPRITFGLYENGVDTQSAFGTLNVSGQDEHGFRPFFLLSSAVVGCATGVLRRELAARGVDYDDIEVVVDVTRNPEILNRIERIELEFRIAADADAPRERFVEAMDAALRGSSMVESVKGAIRVDGRVTMRAA